MTAREKGLAAAIVVLVVAWGLWQGAGAYRAAYDRRVDELQRLELELADEQFEARKARAGMNRLADLRERSLPADPEIARSAYSAWLIEAVEDAGLELGNVKFGGSRRYRDAATALSFTAGAVGPAEAVVRLMDRYYRLGALHQLASLQLRPADEAGQRWSVTLTSVALVVDRTDREEGLPPAGVGDRLARADAEAYVASVVGRNVFASYKPPPPPKPVVAEAKPRTKPAEPPPPDDADHAQLTGIVETGDRLQAWVRVRTTGETLRLHAGDALEVGRLKGRIKDVLLREIVVEADGVTWRTPLGAKLREAQESGG